MSERGTIVRVRTDKGYGFVASDLDGREYFFHASAVSPHEAFATLGEGHKVDFEPGRGPKGLRTDLVEVI